MPARLPVALTEEARAELGRVRRAAPRLDRRRWSPEPEHAERHVSAHGRFPRQHDRSGRHADAARGWPHPPGLPRPLRRRWRPGADHPDRLGRPGGGAGEPAGPRPAVASALPLEAAAAAGDRGHQVRHRREHRRHRAPRHPRLLPLVGGRAASREIRGARLRLRRGRRYLPLPGRRRRCASCPTARARSGASTPRRQRPVAPARSQPSAPPRSAADASGAALDEAYLDRVRGYHATEPYAKAMRKRQVWVEPLFAEAKDWHGLAPLPACGGWRRSTARRC